MIHTLSTIHNLNIHHISDTHGGHNGVIIPPNIDILVFTGDESDHRNPNLNEVEFYEFAEWFIDLPIKNKYLLQVITVLIFFIMKR